MIKPNIIQPRFRFGDEVYIIRESGEPRHCIVLKEVIKSMLAVYDDGSDYRYNGTGSELVFSTVEEAFQKLKELWKL